MRKLLSITAMFLATTAFASAAELAVLQNGFSIRHEHRQVIGEITRLYIAAGDDSYVDVPTAQIASFAPDDSPVPEKVAPVANSNVDVHGLVADAGVKHGIDPDFVASVVHAESDFNIHAVSPKGARGLMQLMPKTADDFGVKDSFDPAANVDAGAKYLRALLDQYNGDVPKALAAYNAGAKRVAQYNGVPPYHETRAYVRSIIAEYNRKKAAEKKALEASTKHSSAASAAGSR
ncbi:MAG TPA: lytic transglycosylase domain-containing protein [Candidatus Koribacter sp.]|jgi:soluble lytic murein transglycosylase-like protein